MQGMRTESVDVPATHFCRKLLSSKTHWLDAQAVAGVHAHRKESDLSLIYMPLPKKYVYCCDCWCTINTKRRECFPAQQGGSKDCAAHKAMLEQVREVLSGS